MKKILVAVDFSDYSEYALEVAAIIAKQHQAEIICLHMIGLSEAVINRSPNKEMYEGIEYMKLIKRKFNQFLDKDFLKGLEVTDTIENYKNFSEFCVIAENLNVDLIVMGSHGSSGFSELYIGSNTEKVVRFSNVPVLVIKNRMDDFKIEKAVFACNFALENKSAYYKAMKFFQSFGAQVQLLYINTPDKKFKSSAEMEQTLREFLISTAPENLEYLEEVAYYSDYTVEEGIFNYSNKIDADIIAIPTHGRKGIMHFFVGSVGEDMVNHSEIPVITFKI